MPAVEEKELKKFGLLLGAVVPAIFGILLPLAKGRGLSYWPWLVAAGLMPLSLFFPAALRPLHRAWMALGQVLGWINTRLLLSLLFFLIFTPVGLFRRGMGKNKSPLTDEGSYRVPSGALSPEGMERPY